MFADYNEFAADFRRQCRERREAEEEQRREVEALGLGSRTPESREKTKTANAAEPEPVSKTQVNGAGAGLVYKVNTDAHVAKSEVVRTDDSVLDDDGGLDTLTQDAAAYATTKTPKADPYPWWTWVDRNLEYRHNFMREVIGQLIRMERRSMREHCAGEIGVVKREVEQQNREFAVRLHEQVLECGRDLREEARAAREQQERRDAVTLYKIGVARRELALLREAGAEALGFVKRELEQQRAAFNAQTELQREREQLRAEVAKDDRLRMQSESDLLRRELTTLREEVAIERGLQALKAEIAAAKAEIPEGAGDRSSDRRQAICARGRAGAAGSRARENKGSARQAARRSERHGSRPERAAACAKAGSRVEVRECGWSVHHERHASRRCRGLASVCARDG
jgi:hypothetical protein